jgi:hypothetical protein
MLEQVTSQASSNDHFLVLLITYGGGLGGIFATIWRAAVRLGQRFEAVERGLAEVKEDQVKLARKVKLLQKEAREEVYHQVAERKRVLQRESS